MAEPINDILEILKSETIESVGSRKDPRVRQLRVKGLLWAMNKLKSWETRAAQGVAKTP